MEEVTPENRFKCHICSKTFTSKQNLDNHVRIHTGEKPFQCDICKKTFAQKSNLVGHERIHTGEKPFEWDICGLKFSQSSSLKLHHKIHVEEKNFKCDVCGKQFTHKRSLSLHLKIHTGEKNFVCNICEKSFTLKSNLDQHLKVHTGDKPYQCKVCGKSFSRNGDLNQHMVVHTGEKPHQCKVCEKSFLKTHMVVHTREKPYKCKVCEKSFTYKHVLNQHMVVHTGEKPYSCDKCGKSFNTSSHVSRHKKICKGQSSSMQNETNSTSDIQDETKSLEEERIDDPSVVDTEQKCGILENESSDKSEMNNKDDIKIQVTTKVTDTEISKHDPAENDLDESNENQFEIISTIEIEEFKLETISEEDNLMIELPTQVKDNEISDIIKRETSEIEETVASTSNNFTQFVDCGETIKEEIKVELPESEELKDPISIEEGANSFSTFVKKYPCGLCDETFLSEEDLLDHWRDCAL